MGRGVKYKLNQVFGDWTWSSENFWRKVDKKTDDECWPWLGSMGPAGPLFGAYRIHLDGTHTPQMTQARRILFTEHTGRRLESFEPVYHKCCNSNCMNPLHQTLTRTVCKGKL